MGQQRSYEKAGSSTLVMGLKIFGYCVLAGIMSLMLYTSLTMLVEGLFKEPEYYVQYQKIDGEWQPVTDKIYFNEEITPESLAEVGTEDKYNEISYTPNPIATAVGKTVSQLLMLMILYVLAGYYTYREGDLDRNLVINHNRKPTLLRGLWIGLIAAVPALAVYALLIIGKCGVLSESVQGVFRMLNPCFLPLIEWIMPLEQYPATTLEVWQLLVFLLLILTTPAVCTVMYIVGYKRWIKPKTKKAK